ncbi:PQQ-binding-like beta-propeller repeat protein [Chloroflexota bacterium]
MLLTIKKIRSGKTLLPVLLLLSLLLVMSCVSAPSRGWSGPIVSDGIVYVGTIEGKVIALDASTGTLTQWEQELEEQKSSAFSCSGGISTPMSIYGTPAVKDNVIYVGGYDGKVYVTKTDGFSSEPFDTGDAIIGSPVIWEDTLFIGNSDGKFYALSTDNIKNEKWVFKTGDKIWSTPVVDKDNRVVYVTSADHKLYAIDAGSGTEIWRFKAEAGIFSTPLIHENKVYIGANDSKFYAIDAATEEERVAAIDRGEGESAPERTADWVFEGADNWFHTTALAYDGWIYVGNLDSKVYAINIEDHTGKAVLETDGRVRTPPVLLNERIIIGSEDGFIYAINPEDKTATQLIDLEEPVFAPMFADTENDILYVHAQNGNHVLYAIDVETKSVIWDYTTD